jgi:hypothetical protein
VKEFDSLPLVHGTAALVRHSVDRPPNDSNTACFAHGEHAGGTME